MSNQLPKPVLAIGLALVVLAGAYGFTRLPEPVIKTVMGLFSPLSPEADPALDAPRISVEEAQKLEGALLVDVRGAGPYEQEHIAGAISAPNHELEKYLDKLPKDRAIICYCSCPNDHLSLVAAAKLIKQHGYPKAYALAGGLPRWKQLGYPLIVISSK
ncbi:rhodanese-like domain-containing protein [bacterium]|nr:rhodanese-like domain-containing protein [bacterium]